MIGGLQRDAESILSIDEPGLGIKITDEFLAKHKFDPEKTQEMELKTFNTME